MLFDTHEHEHVINNEYKIYIFWLDTCTVHTHIFSIGSVRPTPVLPPAHPLVILANFSTIILRQKHENVMASDVRCRWHLPYNHKLFGNPVTETRCNKTCTQKSLARVYCDTMY